MVERILAAHALAQRDLPAARRVQAHMYDEWSNVGFRQWLDRAKPTAIVSTSANLPEIMRELKASGRRIPHDVAYVNLNAVDDGNQLAGINQNSARLGAVAVDLLVAKLNRNERGLPAEPHLTLVPGEWRSGWSLPEPAETTAPSESARSAYTEIISI